MKQYMLLFRLDILNKDAQPSKSEMKVYMTQWMEWLNWIAEKGQLAEGGNHLQYSGRVLKPGKVVRDIPYSSNKESVAGYILINAKNLDDATRLAEKCPILNGSDKNSVEIRETARL
ncbi:MAG: transcription initiation protein [Bacteroidia bacterium]|nr:transcription initiation protein [Bacteroidia bacterium]